MMSKTQLLGLFFGLFLLPQCSVEVQEAMSLGYPVVLSPGFPNERSNDEGWSVRLSDFRMAVKNLEFTIEGEVHGSWLDGVSDMLIPCAYAHPGHSAGGEVTGELVGRFVLDLTGIGPQELGTGTLLEGDYRGFNLYFRTADVDDGLADGDPLLGHGAYIEGTASKSGVDVSFSAVIDESPDASMVGGVFVHRAQEGDDATLAVQFADWVDLPGEGPASIFDGIDFGALDQDEDGVANIEVGQAAHNIIMKSIVIHDFWKILVQ